MFFSPLSSFPTSQPWSDCCIFSQPSLTALITESGSAIEFLKEIKNELEFSHAHIQTGCLFLYLSSNIILYSVLSNCAKISDTISITYEIYRQMTNK